MKLTVLGSGSAIFNPKAEYRYPAAHLVETKNTKILLDAGLGVLPQITKLGLTVADIPVIAVTHFHADHCNLTPLMQLYFLHSKYMGGDKPNLHILGPKGIIERAKLSFDQSGFSYADDFEPNVNITYTEYEDSSAIHLNKDITLIPYKTAHYTLDAYALRVETPEGVIAYSGDSAASDGLVTCAQNVDLFLCEAFVATDKPSDLGHVNPKDAAELAKKAGSKKLVLTHYPGYESIDEIKTSALQAGFAGDIDVAVDLSSYEV